MLDVFTKAPATIQEHVTTFRGIPDYVELNEIVKETESIAIIGGGFLGSELACALARRGNQLNLICILRSMFLDSVLNKY